MAVSLKHHLTESLVLTAVAPACEVAGAAAGAARDERRQVRQRDVMSGPHPCPRVAGVGLSAFPDAGRAPNGRCPSLVVAVYRSSFSSFARFLETQRAPTLAGAALDGALVSGGLEVCRHCITLRRDDAGSRTELAGSPFALDRQKHRMPVLRPEPVPRFGRDRLGMECQAGHA